MSRLVRSAVALAVALAAQAAQAGPPETAALIGIFVGRAADDTTVGDRQEQRDIVMEIANYRQHGLRVSWNNVTLVDGRRDVPGVKFRRDELVLAPAPGRGFFLAGVGYDPFTERKEPDALAGDALRWGVVSGESLRLYAFTILDDGTYELQTTVRSPEDDGVRLEFERIVDGEVRRRMIGHAVRAD
jgi:hypothetical protein